MSKPPIIDPATAARIRAEIRSASNGLITDRVIVLEAAIEAILRALEQAKS